MSMLIKKNIRTAFHLNLALIYQWTSGMNEETSKWIHIFVSIRGSPEIVSLVYEFLEGQQVSTPYLAFRSQLLLFVIMHVHRIWCVEN